MKSTSDPVDQTIAVDNDFYSLALEQSIFLEEIASKVIDLIVSVGPLASVFSDIAAECANKSSELRNMAHTSDNKILH